VGRDLGEALAIQAIEVNLHGLPESVERDLMIIVAQHIPETSDFCPGLVGNELLPLLVPA